MGKLIISTNVTLDGVVQDPDGQEGFALGGWFNEHGGADLEGWAQVFSQETEQTAALLLGRNSDAWFAERWLGRDGAWADRLNALPKYVVSSTPPRWSNASLVKVDEIAELKQRVDGDLVVYASYPLARALLERDLVDEVRLVVFPVVLGAGERLFGQTSHTWPLRLTESRTVGENLQFVTYERAA